MKRKILSIVTITVIFLLYGCVTTGTKTTVTAGQDGPSISEARAEAYNGPKARIAVAQFKNKAGNQGGWWNPQIGSGMADQLVTALFNSNRFIVLERQTLGDVLAEQDLGAAGRIKKGTEAAIGEIEGAELLVVAAVTEFDGAASGTQGGIGGGAFGGAGAIIGAVTGGFRKAHMAIDLRIIDARTSRILAATSVEGESTDVNLGGAVGGFFGGGALGGALSGWKNTPKEKALRQVINKAVEFIIQKTPQKFYHYGGNAPVNQPKPAANNTVSNPGRAVTKEMQGLLNALGYNSGAPDGLMGKKTRAAISAFQRDYGLPENGQLNPGTIKLIRKMSK